MIGAALLTRIAAAYGPQLAIAGVLALVAGGGFVALKHHFEQEGRAKALHDVATDNQEAVDEVNQNRGRVLDCLARDGMRWAQGARECVRRD